MDTALDGERPHRLDDVDGARAEAVEVAGEQGVRAAQLAGAALGAVDVVGGDVGDVELAALHRDDVRVEGGRRPRLVALDLGDRADLAAELVARREAVVRGVAPLLDELPGLRVGEGERQGPGEGLGVVGQLRRVGRRAGGEGPASASRRVRRSGSTWVTGCSSSGGAEVGVTLTGKTYGING